MPRLVHFAWLSIVLFGAAAASAKPQFAGTWDTSFGRMHLQQDKHEVKGFYVLASHLAKIEGKLEKSRWTFRFREPNSQGEGHFELADDGQSFAGKWRPKGTVDWQPWTGRRIEPPAKVESFDGVWNTSLGKLRLTTSKDTARGCYAFPAGATLDGKLAGGTFNFNYHEPDAEGEGRFVLSADGRAFHGQWRPKGAETWLDWFGHRAEPVPGRAWLVVLEANWEHDLAEPEYSFGSMLRAFFARSPRVQVRHRFVNDSDDLARACQEIAYLTEPVLLVVASHGTGQGVSIGPDTVGAESFAEALRYAPKLKLLHFSSCSVMQDKLAETLQAECEPERRFPISGYTQSVDWAASAVIEFLYFDMILSRGMRPSQAADQVKLLLPFSSEKQLDGAAIPPAGFRVLLPGAPAPKP